MGWEVRPDLESRAQATAWLAPFPPGKVVNEVAFRVSPGDGSRAARVVMSTLSEPKMAIFLGMMVILPFNSDTLEGC